MSITSHSGVHLGSVCRISFSSMLQSMEERDNLVYEGDTGVEKVW